MTSEKLSKLRPLLDHIIVQPIDEMETHASGLIIPDTVSKEKPQKGRVIAVGPGKADDKGELIKPGISKGEIVLFTKYGPTEIKFEGEDLLILNESDILAVIDQ